MGFKAKKVIVDPSDPFKNDKLSRQGDVENLTLLLRNISSPIVLSVNAPWGSGKTTFLEMLNVNLKINGCHSVYFSAWETDFASDPLLAFLGEMNKELSSLVKKDDAKKEAWSKAKKAGAHIVKKGIPVLIKLGTAGILDAEVAKFTTSLSTDLLGEYTKNKGAIADFKDSIAEILKSEAGEEKLYIFVDELDRCRPTYAIELLERIKHLLDIDGLVFILAMDKEQLSHGVKGVYGEGFEATGYLRRFIDIEYSLPEADIDSYIDYLYEIFKFDIFFEKRKDYRAFDYEVPNLKNVFKLLVKVKPHSLREVEQLFSKLNLVIHSTKENTYLYPALLAFLLIIKDSAQEIYSDYIQKGSAPEKMIGLLHTMIPAEQRYESHECALIEGFLIAAKNESYDKPSGKTIDLYRKNIDDHDCEFNTPEYRAREYSRIVAAIADAPIEQHNQISLSNIVSRIEMTENFIFHMDTAK